MNISYKDNDKHKTPGGFKLIRHFTLTAMISIAVAAILLGNLYQQSARTFLLDDAKQHHQEIARLYKTFIWSIYGDFLLKLDHETVANASELPMYVGLHSRIQREINESRVLKLKVFNHEGLTVYSSDPNQKGQNKKGYPGFESAMLGSVTSELSLRKEFDRGGHHDTLYNKHVYSSYIPVFSSINDENVIAIIELYTDVTHLANDISASKVRLLCVTVIIMLLLFSILLINVIRADKLIKAQERIQRAMKEQAYWQANHDALTELPTRNYFNELLLIGLQSIKNTEQIIVVMYIDLDLFKPINDRYGHHTGDLVLQEVAKRITNALPPDSVVARPGGDEFTSFFRIDKAKADVASDVTILLEAISAPYQFGEIECELSASIGITYCDNPDTDTETLIAEADSAMYKSKKMGRGIANNFADDTHKRAA